jgi:putative ABC transport system permease protein
MSTATKERERTSAAVSGTGSWAADLVPNLRLGLDNLRLHKLRSFLTMLGMIFGVAAVVSMMSIGAGAQREVMAFIEGLGVRNLIVEAREATDRQALARVRQTSPGLTFRDLRAIRANVEAIERSTARKRFLPGKLVPRPPAEMPTVFGVSPSYQAIAGLRLSEGRFLTEEDDTHAAAVCVLGQAVREHLFGDRALGEHVKVNEQWFRVVGVAGPQLALSAEAAGLPAEDRNNTIYVPLGAAILRLEDAASDVKDEIDGIYLQVGSADDVSRTAAIVRGLLNESHRNTPDFSIVVPAELLAQQRRTQRIFEMVMVAIASISLLVGGIGIMNIMLASILERTREIGLRRAVGARQREIVRQFLLEAVLISGAGGLAGVLVGIAMARAIAHVAGWTTIVSTASIVLAVAVSVSVGLLFGVYPARKAARLDPVRALHYE